MRPFLLRAAADWIAHFGAGRATNFAHSQLQIQRPRQNILPAAGTWTLTMLTPSSTVEE
jgi:hypothetical protein